MMPFHRLPSESVISGRFSTPDPLYGIGLSCILRIFVCSLSRLFQDGKYERRGSTDPGVRVYSKGRHRTQLPQLNRRLSLSSIGILSLVFGLRLQDWINFYGPKTLYKKMDLETVK